MGPSQNKKVISTNSWQKILWFFGVNRYQPLGHTKVSSREPPFLEDPYQSHEWRLDIDALHSCRPLQIPNKA